MWGRRKLLRIDNSVLEWRSGLSHHTSDSPTSVSQSSPVLKPQPGNRRGCSEFIDVRLEVVLCSEHDGMSRIVCENTQIRRAGDCPQLCGTQNHQDLQLSFAPAKFRATEQLCLLQCMNFDAVKGL